MTIREYLQWIAPGKRERIQINYAGSDKRVCRFLSDSADAAGYADRKISHANPDPKDVSVDTIIYIEESGDTDDTIQS